MALADLRKMDPIVEAVAGVDTGRLRTVAEQWDAVVNAIFRYQHEFDSRTSEVAKHWRGKASAALQDSAETASGRMSDWAREAPNRATSMRIVAYYVDDMLRYLQQKQAQRTEDLNTIITAYNNAVKQSREYFLAGPSGIFGGYQTAFKIEMVDEVGNQRKTVEGDFWDWFWGEAYDMEARLQEYKNEVTTFYDQLAVAVATKYGGLINKEKEWTSPGRYLGLHTKGGTFDPGGKPELDRPGGPGGGGGGTGDPGGGGTTRPRQPDIDGRTKPIVDPPKQDPTKTTQDPPRQDPTKTTQDQQPQQQQQQQPQTEATQPPPPSSSNPQQPLVPTPVPPPVTGLPALPIVQPRAGSPVAGGGVAGGGIGGRGGGAGSTTQAGLAGRLGEAGPAVLSGRAAGAPAAQQPYFPPIPPGAPGAAGGAAGGRPTRPRRPITIGGARVVDDGRSGAGAAVSGRQMGRKKAEPPRQPEEQLTGYEIPAAEEQEERRHERRMGGAA